MSYNPDVWHLIRIKNTETGKSLYRLLAGWYGGYTGSNSWRLNSGITKIETDPENPDVYKVWGFSGSVYTCHKNGERLSGLTADIFGQMEKQAAETTKYEVSLAPIEGVVIDFEEAKSFL